MVWVIVVVAIVVLALGAWAGTGRLGELPPVVDDRPKGRIPDGPIDAGMLARLRIPHAATGYSPAQVDAYLTAFADGGAEGMEAAFDVVAGGYDMQVVDELLHRTALPLPPAPSVPPPADAPHPGADDT